MSLSPFRMFADLPEDYVPKFPEKCVGCYSDRPDHRVTIWTYSSSWWSLIFPIVILFTTRTKRVTFPACRRCAWGIRFRRMFSFAFMIGSVLVAVFLVAGWTEGWNRLLRRLAAIGVVVVGAVPWICSEAWFPQAVTLTLEDHLLKYEFRDIEFSSEFRMLNRDALRR